MFSASTCLTNLGTTTLGPDIQIYSNYDSYTTLIMSVPLANITPPLCPYILLLPNGTTTVKLYDPISGCFCYIQANDLCESCNINFSQYSSDIVSLISVGNITGSCDPSITDYKITWYGPGVGSTTVAFTSGSGATFAPYDYVHPLTGSSAVLVEEGVYTPVLETIDINGTIFSNTGGTSTIYASLDCLDGTNVSVSAFTCDNGTMVDNYMHSISFLNAGGGNFPQPMSATYRLSSAVKYFAWKFNGFAIPDKLRLTFSGANYSVPIYLEYWEVGATVGNNFNDNVWPKSATTISNGNISKVTCLTGFTITDDDFITIEITPSITNLQTNFELSCTCLFDFNCDTCIDNNTPYKIVSADTVSSTASTGCYDYLGVTLVLSGCSYDDNNSFDLRKYYQKDTIPFFGQYIINIDTNNSTHKISNSNSLFWDGSNSCSVLTNSGVVYCAVQGTGTITFNKTIPTTEGLITMTFTDVNDFNTYINNYNAITAQSGTPYNDLSVNYYRGYNLYIPNGSPCGDGTPKLSYLIHPSTVVTTGLTLGIYSIEMTMPTISNNLTWTSCDITCSFQTDFMVNQINNSSTGTTNNISLISTESSKYVNPLTGILYLQYNTASPKTSYGVFGYYQITKKFNESHPSSGTSYTLIPSLSSVTCSDLSQKFITNISNPDNWIQYAYSYEVRLMNPLNLHTFTVFSHSPTPNDIALEVVNGVITYCNPLYVV